MTRPFHSDRMLSKFKAESAEYSTCSVALESPITARQTNGTVVETWQAVGVYDGRIAKATNTDSQKFASRGVIAANLWAVVVPAGVAVATTQRVTVTLPARLGVPASQVIAYIVGSNAPREHEADITVYAEERDAT